MAAQGPATIPPMVQEMKRRAKVLAKKPAARSEAEKAVVASCLAQNIFNYKCPHPPMSWKWVRDTVSKLAKAEFWESVLSKGVRSFKDLITEALANMQISRSFLQKLGTKVEQLCELFAAKEGAAPPKFDAATIASGFACAQLFSLVFETIRFVWHKVQEKWAAHCATKARNEGADFTEIQRLLEEEATHAVYCSEILSFDNVVRHSVPNAIGATLCASIGPLGWMAYVVIFLVQVIAEYAVSRALEQKNAAGGWWAWLTGAPQMSDAQMSWVDGQGNSPTLDSVYNGTALRVQYPDIRELMCPITHEFIVEPVYTIYGDAFERAALVKCLRTHGGKCPVREEPMSLLDVVAWEEARDELERIAGECGWRRVPAE